VAEIILEKIGKSFSGARALSDVDLTISDHEFVVVLGPSGSGKSTLLRIIAGLENPTAGQLTINRRAMAGVPPKDRNVAMVFQSHALYPHMSAYGNLAFSLRIRRVPRRDVAARVSGVAKQLGIEGLLNRRPHQMSGGERQRVAIGRAIVRDPQVFLFDEPLSNLDAELRVRLRTEIKRLHHDLCWTAVYVTHDQIEAMTLADRLVVLRAGEVEQIGTPSDLYERPANTFVAGFVGSPSMNMLAGVLSDGHLHMEIGVRLPIQRVSVGSLTVGIRPEDILVVGEGGGAVSAKAKLIEPMGADTVIVCQPAQGPEVLVRVPHYQRVKDGETLHLQVRESAIHMFDRNSGRRIA
jgi:ABC-type sugar transport system ATPase subunit